MQYTARAPTRPARFDPAESGTPEHLWIPMLANIPSWAPSTDSLIVVSPHPDDEVLGAGGLIHSWVAAGRPVTIVSVTDGEAAFPRWKQLARIRRAELKGALRALCRTHAALVRMGLPDGRVASHANRLRNALLPLMNPRVTLIAPYEHDGHPDHDVIGGICSELARAHGIAVASYPIWAWHHQDPAALRNKRWGRFSLSAEARRAKLRAIQCFQSQLHPPRAPPIVPPHVLVRFARPFEGFLL